jgi:predicted AAA+ superfamily ATPase
MLFKEDIVAAFAGQQDWIQKGLLTHRDYLAHYKPAARQVEVITGVRRCGKSTLMRQIAMKYYKKTAYFNFEDPRIFGFEVADFAKLDSAMGKGVDAYFFDEIQNVHGWELFVRNLHERGEKIFVTGSNASLLSRELGTRLTGRYLSHEIFPFSYGEYLSFQKKKHSPQHFAGYSIMGGFPEFLSNPNPEVLQMLLKDILYRDIAVRHNIKNSHVLMNIALYLISNVGKEVSLNGIKKSFDVGSATTVSDYLAWLQDAYMLFFLPRFSWSAKSVNKNPKKVYTIDNGLAKANSLSFTKDEGRLLENLVYLSLRKSFIKIFYFRERKECDFVVFENNTVKWLIQVCASLHADNRDREVGGLLAAMEFFDVKTGHILTTNQSDSLKVEGRKVIVQPVSAFFGSMM